MVAIEQLKIIVRTESKKDEHFVERINCLLYIALCNFFLLSINYILILILQKLLIYNSFS